MYFVECTYETIDKGGRMQRPKRAVASLALFSPCCPHTESMVPVEHDRVPVNNLKAASLLAVVDPPRFCQHSGFCSRLGLFAFRLERTSPFYPTKSLETRMESFAPVVVVFVVVSHIW